MSIKKDPQPVQQADPEKVFTTDDTVAAENAAGAKLAAEGNLPASQYAAAEAKREKAAELMAEAAEMETAADLGVVDPSKLKIDREVSALLDNTFKEIEVEDPQEGFRYVWIFRDPHNDTGGAAVRRMQSIGYEVVSGDMPEARKRKSVTGERWVADCLLMRVPMEKYLDHQIAERRRRLLLQDALLNPLREMTDRLGVKLFDELPDFATDQIHASARMKRAEARADYHRMNRDGTVDNMIRKGRVAGAPPPGLHS